jgi:hypothetical protein
MVFREEKSGEEPGGADASGRAEMDGPGERPSLESSDAARPADALAGDRGPRSDRPELAAAEISGTPGSSVPDRPSLDPGGPEVGGRPDGPLGITTPDIAPGEADRDGSVRTLPEVTIEGRPSDVGPVTTLPEVTIEGTPSGVGPGDPWDGQPGYPGDEQKPDDEKPSGRPRDGGEGSPVKELPEITIEGNPDGKGQTPFERSVSETARPGEYQPRFDPATGNPAGFIHNKGGGYWENVDRDGNVISSGEIPIEKPLLDPIDFIPGPEILAGLAKAIGGAVVEGVGKLLAGVVGKAGAEAVGEGAAKVVGETVAKSGGEALAKSGGEAVEDTAAKSGLGQELGIDIDGLKPTETPQPGTYVENGPGRSNEARTTAGEQTMAFAHGADGWNFIEGPSGTAGHRWNGPGPDGVAFRIAQDGGIEIRVIDNKAWASAEKNIGSASGLTGNQLGNLSDRLADPALDGVPRIGEIRESIGAAAEAAATGRRLPDNVNLTVTTYWGNSPDITKGLAGKGVTIQKP